MTANRKSLRVMSKVFMRLFCRNMKNHKGIWGNESSYGLRLTAYLRLCLRLTALLRVCGDDAFGVPGAVDLACDGEELVIFIQESYRSSVWKKWDM